nr:uncharacterized protein LOC112279562 isoform X2 [Physcomitrium patens]|eukprot:XP_024369915.1 uncharacterized protein LOC112279562 isoform X2 [Physcomitrella patens]
MPVESPEPGRQSCTTTITGPERQSSSFARGSESQITFGECMTPKEAEGLIVRRPRSECRQMDLVGNHRLEENCGGVGLDVSGGLTFRPCSSSKTQELAGHDVFAFTNASDSPPPPVRVPYCPQEIRIPPHEMPRNPKRLESHLQMGDLVVSPKRPSTCPSSISYQIRSPNCEGYDFFSRARLVEEAKTRAFRGNNIFDFNDEPRNMEEDGHNFTLSKLARRRDLRGNDIFGDSKLGDTSDLRSPAPYGRRHVGPCNSQFLRENPLSSTDSACHRTALESDSV